MTREEAKKSLQNTKVYVAGKSKEIQEKLFEIGFEWGGKDKHIQLVYYPFILVDTEEITCANNMVAFGSHPNKEITADYILGLTWEEEKPQYQFKPFDKVLVRDVDEEDWYAAFYSHQDDDGRFVINGGWYYRQCIPYEGNEDLVGTTNQSDYEEDNVQ